ncbi:MAG: RidA family protein [Candidatus Wallbacteria bacterium]|nr:RidA family protein [Candidatus Wallbacteria bacterium]
MVQRVRSGSPYEETIGFSRAVRVGDRVLVSGTAPIPLHGREVATGAHAQMVRCGEIISAALAEVGASLANVVRTRMFLTDASDAQEVGHAHCQIFGDARPAATMVVVSALLDPRWRVEVEAEAVVTEESVGAAPPPASDVDVSVRCR